MAVDASSYRSDNTHESDIDAETGWSGMSPFTTGGGSIQPSPLLAHINIAQAALRNWVLNLHTVLTDRGVYAAHVAISPTREQRSNPSAPHHRRRIRPSPVMHSTVRPWLVSPWRCRDATMDTRHT